MSVNLSPVGGVAQQFFDNNGQPLSGGKIYTYASGTTTPQTTYTSAAGVTAHANPIILNSAGRVPSGEIWLTGGTAYKFIIYTSVDVLIGSYDNISGINDFISLTPKVFNAIGDGVTVSYDLLATPASESATSVYVNGVYQQKNTYSLLASQLTFSEAPPFTAAIEVMYF